MSKTMSACFFQIMLSGSNNFQVFICFIKCSSQIMEKVLYTSFNDCSVSASLFSTSFRLLIDVLSGLVECVCLRLCTARDFSGCVGVFFLDCFQCFS